jgi:hypothetical protein
MKNKEKQEILKGFCEKILDQKINDPEFSKIVNENFWELLQGSKPMEGKELQILKKTMKRLISKTPTTLNKKGETNES